MSLALSMLLAFAGWTLIVLIVGVGMRRWLLILKRQAALTSFPGDMPHGSAAYRRAMRAHANCVENLPVFAAIVLVGAAVKVSTPGIDRLAAVTMAARIIQTLVHLLLAETNAAIAMRFAFFLVQVAAMIGMAVATIIAVTPAGAA